MRRLVDAAWPCTCAAQALTVTGAMHGARGFAAEEPIYGSGGEHLWW